jgi:hypothetical protein
MYVLTANMVVGEELGISLSKAYSPTQIALDEFQFSRTPVRLFHEAY